MDRPARDRLTPTALRLAALVLGVVLALGTAALFSGSAQAIGELATASSATATPGGSIDQPKDGAGIRGVVTVAATPAPDAKVVASVSFEFRAAPGGTWAPLGTVTSAPYEVSWDTAGLADGRYELRATTTDDGGATWVTPTITVTLDTVAPAVALDDPGAVLHGTVALHAPASDAGSGIASVEFQRAPAGSDTWQSIGVASSAPYGVDFDTTVVEDGLYDLRAIATDAAGNTTVSATVRERLVANVAPSATLDDPGASLAGTVRLTASASASPGRTISSVDFQYRAPGGGGWVSIGTTTSAPYTAELDTTTVPDGLYDFRIVATDSAGTSSTSPSVADRLIANESPVAILGDPGTPLVGSLTLKATAHANGGRAVALVTFQRSPAGEAAWTTIETVESPPYEAQLDTTAVQNGLYDLRVAVTDTAGNTANSAVVRDRLVSNTAPTAVLDDPGQVLQGSIALTATASPNNGTELVSADFQRSPAGKNDWTTIDTARQPPWSVRFDTTTVADGLYDVRVVVTDSAGGKTTPAPRLDRLVANNAPAVTLGDPGAEIQGSVPLTATASASPGRVIVSVAFQRAPAGSGTWTTIGTSATPPYGVSFATTTVADGLYDLRALATDSSGDSSSSPPVANVRVNNTAPLVRLDDPGDTLSGTVTLSASANAKPGVTVTSVALQWAPTGTGSWTTIGSDTTAPYSVDFDTTAVPDGLYDLRAIATDSTGRIGASRSLRERLIVNGGPVVALDDPGRNLRASVVLSASLSPQPGTTIASVEFQRATGGPNPFPGFAPITPTWTTIGTDTTFPYTAVFDTTTVRDGLYDLRVVATDSSGSRIASPPRRAARVDNVAPLVTLADPGATLKGEVRLSASAGDTGGSGIASVTFQRAAAGSDSWQTLSTLTGLPYGASFDSALIPNGSYDLRAVATDSAGNVATSVVAARQIDNPPGAGPPHGAIVTSLAPAHAIQLLGSISGSIDHETWAYGFTSAPPASVQSKRLPYTAAGNQLVLLRYGDRGGWQIADVLRNPDGTAFQLLPADQVEANQIAVSGAMAPSGEGWLWLLENPTDPSKPQVYGLFHRAPGDSFTLDTAATAALAPLLQWAQGGRLRLHETDGKLGGILLAPGQEPKQVMHGGKKIFEALEYGALSNGTWSLETAPEPPTYAPEKFDTLQLVAADVDGADSAWAALILLPGFKAPPRPRPLLLARIESGSWSYRATGLPALDLSGAFNDPHASVLPLGLTADPGGVWISAQVSLPSGSAPLIARYDSHARSVTTSWCSLPVLAPACAEQLDVDHPAALPDATFETPTGPVALALRKNVLDLFADGSWTTVPAPGFTTAAPPLFTSPDDGWLVGSSALGRWSAAEPMSEVVSWPEPNRVPLLGLAVPPGFDGSTQTDGALAVGLNGTALVYSKDAGWQVVPVPAREKHVNLFGVAYAAPDQAFAVGQFGSILRWSGGSWTEDPQSISITQSQLNAVAFDPSGEGWAVGAFGTILHYDGTAWSIEKPPPANVSTNITSVAVAGNDVLAVAGGNLIERAPDGSWNRVAPSQLPSPAPPPGSFRVVSGLADGGAVVVGKSIVIVRQHPGLPFDYSAQPLEGVGVAAAAFRANGEVRALVSLALPALDPDSLTPGTDVAGQPPGDGELMQQTADGWKDVQHAQYAGSGSLPGDGALKIDPVLAVAAAADGSQGWAVGGYAGTISAAGQGTSSVLPARPAGWQTSSIWHFNQNGEPAPAQPSLFQGPQAPPAWAQGLGPFAGVGVFTSAYPSAVLDSGGGISWVAVQAGVATPVEAERLRQAGFRILVWESEPQLGQQAVDRYHADGYIAQAEGPGQLAAALALGPGLRVPKALVTNLFMDRWPSGWVAMPEAYQNVNPLATPGATVQGALNRGATTVAPVIGTYDATSEGSGPRALVAYLPELGALGTGSFSAFLGEELTVSDYQAIAARPAPAAPVSNAPTTVSTLQATPGTVGFAFFSSPTCRVLCSEVVDSQPDVNTKAAAATIATYAQQPGGPAFAMLGGNARGPLDPASRTAGNAAFDFPKLPSLFAPLGNLPLFAAYGPLDDVPGRVDRTGPWAGAFVNSPIPFGSGPPANGIVPAGPAGPPVDGVHRYYAFDASQNGGTLRVIVLDNSAGSLESTFRGQTAWLQAELSAARSAGVPVVVVTALPLRGNGTQPGLAKDGLAVATLLANSGVSAVFTTNGPNQLNEQYLVPDTPPSGQTQIPEYEGATLGYQQSGNNGVVWYFVSVDTASIDQAGRAPVSVQAVPVLESLSLEPIDGTSVNRSSTLLFQAIGRRPPGSLATTPSDDSFPGIDNYVSIPATSCPSSACVRPTYSFSSSDPTIGDFVVPSGPGSRFPSLNGQGHPTHSSTSGLFCAFNSGETVVSVTVGLVTASTKVTVRDGGFGPPCGTVFRAGVGQTLIVYQRASAQSVQQEGAGPGGAAAPPPPAPVAASSPPPPPPPPPPPAAVPAPVPPPAPKPIVVPPAPLPPPAPLAPAPFIAPPPPLVTLPFAVPVPPAAIQPVPPGGAVAQSPAAARAKRKVEKEASQSAYTIRPAGSSGDWFYPLLGVVTVLGLVLAAAGVGRATGPRPAVAWLDRRNPRG